MIIKIFSFFLLSLFSSLIMLLCSGKFLYAIITFLLFISSLCIDYFLLLNKREKNYKKQQDLLLFLHDFLYIYCLNFNYEEALDNSLCHLSKITVEQLNLYKEYPSKERLRNYANYFDNYYYHYFLDILEYEGSNKLSFLYQLIDKNNVLLSLKSKKKKSTIKGTIEFMILWMLSFLILMLLRLVINNYFDKIGQNIFYILGLSFYFLIWLVSLLFVLNILYPKEVYLC